jgi:hypothetical protein
MGGVVFAVRVAHPPAQKASFPFALPRLILEHGHQRQASPSLALDKKIIKFKIVTEEQYCSHVDELSGNIFFESGHISS